MRARAQAAGRLTRANVQVLDHQRDGSPQSVTALRTGQDLHLMVAETVAAGRCQSSLARRTLAQASLTHRSLSSLHPAVVAASGPGRRASASPAATQPQLHPAVVAASGPGRRASALPAATQQQRICTAERQFTRGVEMRWREGWRRLAPFRVTPSPAHVVVTVAKRHRDVSTTAPGQRCATEHTRTHANTGNAHFYWRK